MAPARSSASARPLALLYACLSLAQLLVTTFWSRRAAPVASPRVLAECALVMLLALLAASTFLGPFVPLGQERRTLWYVCARPRLLRNGSLCALRIVF